MRVSKILHKVKYFPNYVRNKIERFFYLTRGFFVFCPQLKNWWLYPLAILGLLKKGKRYVFKYRNGLEIVFRAGTYDILINLEIFGYQPYSKHFVGDISSYRRVVDIGAQTGVFSLYLFSRNKALVAACVEAMPMNVEILTGNIRRNGLSDRVTIYQRAAWSKSGEKLTMNESEHNIGGHSLIRGGSGYTPGPMVETISLQDIIGTEQCDLLKIDIEGAEYELLFAAPPDTLHLIRQMAMEVHGGKEKDQELARFLDQNGFDIITEPGYLWAHRRT